MRHIRLFRNAAIAAAAPIVAATPAIIASCSFIKEPEPEEPELKDIKINFPQEELNVEEWTTAKSENAVEVNCFDQFGEKFSAKTKIFICDKEGKVSDWVWTDDENKINVSGDQDPGIYSFEIYAKDLRGKVKSNIQNISVEVYKTPLVPPEQLEITCEQTTHRVFYSTTADVELGLTAYAEGHEEKEISKACDWTIEQISGARSYDKYGNPLFIITERPNDSLFQVSKDIDEQYVGQYKLAIKATSKMAPNVFDQIELTINIVNGFEYVDTVNGYTYNRTDLKQPWTLTKVKSTTVVVDKVMEEIYSSPVRKIGERFCEKSSLSMLSTVILPSCITTIADYAFFKQTGFYVLEIPGVKHVGKHAFEGCDKVQFSTREPLPIFQSVEEKAFYNCARITLGDTNSFSEIGDYAFYNTGIVNANLGGCVTSIGKEAFGLSTNLEYIQINQANPPKISSTICTGCSKLKGIKVPESALETYKNDSKWSIYAKYFIKI